MLRVCWLTMFLLSSGNQESVPRVLLQSGQVSRESQQKPIQGCQSMWVTGKPHAVFTYDAMPENNCLFWSLPVVDHSRVKLENTENDYINASLVVVEEAQRNYILTQASPRLCVSSCCQKVTGSAGCSKMDKSKLYSYPMEVRFFHYLHCFVA